MATTVLVKEILWRVSVLLGDTAPQFQRFTEGELVRWLIDGQTAIAKYLPSSAARTDAIKLVQGTKQSVDIVLAANCQPGDGVALTAPLYGIQLFSLVRNMGADGLTVGKAITGARRQDLDAIDEDWHTRTSTSVQDVLADERLPTTFYVSPGIPAAPAVWVEIQWAALPKTIVNTGSVGTERYLIGGVATDTINVHDKHADDLVNYGLARAQLKDAKFAEATKSVHYGSIFVSSLNAQVLALTGVNPNIQHLPGGSDA